MFYIFACCGFLIFDSPYHTSQARQRCHVKSNCSRNLQMTEELQMRDLQVKGLIKKLNHMLGNIDASSRRRVNTNIKSILKTEQPNINTMKSVHFADEIEIINNNYCIQSKCNELDLIEIKQTLKEFQFAIDQVQMELYYLDDDNLLRNKYKQCLRDYKSILKELRNQYESKNSKLIKDELLNIDNSTETKQDDEKEEGLMKHGLNIQNKSTDSLHHTIRIIDDTKHIGQEINTKLDATTAQIIGLYDKLEVIESILSRSTRVIKRIARKMVTDKYVWVVVAIVFCVIVFIILWQNVKKKS